MYAQVNQYRNTQVNTAAPEKILLMLYDGAINFTKLAIEKINANDRAGKGLFISKAQAIVAELMNTLNHDIGGDIAARLEQLYIYIIDQYLDANINNAVQPLENAVRILTMLRDTWAEAIEIWRKEKDTSGLRQAGIGR